jgi:hypothetical protein
MRSGCAGTPRVVPPRCAFPEEQVSPYAEGNLLGLRLSSVANAWTLTSEEARLCHLPGHQQATNCFGGIDFFKFQNQNELRLPSGAKAHTFAARGTAEQATEKVALRRFCRRLKADSDAERNDFGREPEGSLYLNERSSRVCSGLLAVPKSRA